MRLNNVSRMKWDDITSHRRWGVFVRRWMSIHRAQYQTSTVHEIYDHSPPDPCPCEDIKFLKHYEVEKRVLNQQYVSGCEDTSAGVESRSWTSQWKTCKVMIVRTTWMMEKHIDSITEDRKMIDLDVWVLRKAQESFNACKTWFSSTVFILQIRDHCRTNAQALKEQCHGDRCWEDCQDYASDCKTYSQASNDIRTFHKKTQLQHTQSAMMQKDHLVSGQAYVSKSLELTGHDEVWSRRARRHSFSEDEGKDDQCLRRMWSSRSAHVRKCFCMRCECALILSSFWWRGMSRSDERFPPCLNVNPVDFSLRSTGCVVPCSCHSGRTRNRNLTYSIFLALSRRRSDTPTQRSERFRCDADSNFPSWRRLRVMERDCHTCCTMTYSYTKRRKKNTCLKIHIVHLFKIEYTTNFAKDHLAMELTWLRLVTPSETAMFLSWFSFSFFSPLHDFSSSFVFSSSFFY